MSFPFRPGRPRLVMGGAAATLALLGAGPEPAGAIVNGQPIPVTQAPWTVLVHAENSFGANECTGSIIDAARVLTAAHCVTRLGGEPAPAVTIVAGTSNAKDRGQGQQVPAASVRVHPYAQNGLGADDVAVVALQRPLDLSGPSAQAIGLVPPGPGPALGATVAAIGYGQQSPTADSNGLLYLLPHELVDPYLGVNSSCANGGDDAAVRLCPQSAAGAICFGDSGGPLVAGTPPMLVGVASQGTGARIGAPETENCQAGKTSAFVNLAAPEIRAFIDGNDQPPLAPRLEGTVFVNRKGSRYRPRLVCERGDWSNNPTVTHSWIDARGGKTLRKGRTYRLSRRDKGRRLVCAVTGTNAGGTTTYRTSPLRITRFSIPAKRR
jgi:trypsin